MHKRERAQERSEDHPSDKEPELIFVERQFPIVLRWPLIYGLLIILIAMIPWSISTANAYSWQPLAVQWMIVWGIVLLGYWVYHFVGWYFSVLILTEEDITLIRQKGFFKRQVNSLALNNIQSVNYTVPGMQGALFKFGDVTIETLSGSGHMRVKTMFRPSQLQAEILDAVEAFGSTADKKMVYDAQDKDS